MNLRSSRLSVDGILMTLAALACAAAMIAYLFHYLSHNTQYDTQVIDYARTFIEAVETHTVPSYLLEVRKYPLLYVAPFAAVYAGALTVVDTRNDAAIFFIGRLLTLLFALGILALLRRISRTLIGDASAVWLLLCSLLFLQFSTAIRPHVPVAFWTLLSFVFALRAQKHCTTRNLAGTLGSAVIAFATLQSGLLAFIFPAWALLSSKRIGNFWAAVILGAGIFLSLIAGYLPVIARLGVGLDPTLGGHEVAMGYSFSHVSGVLLQLAGSELILLLFALHTLFCLVRRTMKPKLWTVPILIYLAAFVIIFLAHEASSARYFIPTLPFLALLGARTFRDAPGWARRLTWIFLVLMAATLARLAVLPDTYQQMNGFLASREGLVLIAKQPTYFFAVPLNRLSQTEADLAAVRTIVVPGYEQRKPPLPSWIPCHEARASSAQDPILLWNETPWALYRIFEAQALGPNLTAYCRNE
jgi:hypothetical protein